MPRWQILSGVSAPISSPRRRTEPAVGGSAPDTQLNSVVLPEPLGPISPRISPSRTSNDTPLSAVKPPNRFVSPETVSISEGVSLPSSSAGFAGAIEGGGSEGAVEAPFDD